MIGSVGGIFLIAYIFCRAIMPTQTGCDRQLAAQCLPLQWQGKPIVAVSITTFSTVLVRRPFYTVRSSTRPPLGNYAANKIMCSQRCGNVTFLMWPHRILWLPQRKYICSRFHYRHVAYYVVFTPNYNCYVTTLQ